MLVMAWIWIWARLGLSICLGNSTLDEFVAKCYYFAKRRTEK